MPAKPPADLGKFPEAVAHFRARLPVTDEEYAALDAESQRRAFKVAGVAQLDLVTQVWNAIDGALAEGTTLEDFKAQVGPALAEAWGGEQPYRVETIFRTNVQTAYGAGRWKQLTDPDILDTRPYWRFSTVLDSRTTEICQECAGTVLPADHPWWAQHNPPLHFNCRSGIIALTEAQADTFGVRDAPPPADAAKGFGAAPGADDWEPDLSAYPASLAEIYRSR